MAAYRARQAYRAARTYRGLELAPAVTAPSATSSGTLGWQRARDRVRMMGARFAQAPELAVVCSARFGVADEATNLLTLLAGDSARREANDLLPWQDAPVHGFRVGASPLAQLAPASELDRLPWGDHDVPRSRVSAIPLRKLQAYAGAILAPWQQAIALNKAMASSWRRVAARGGVVALPWSPAYARTAGLRIEWPVEPNPGDSPITVPIRPVYVMIPTLTAHRVADGVAIPLLSATIERTDGEFAWTLSAPIAFAARDLVDPTAASEPVEIEVAVNGFAWRFTVEGVDDNRRFGANSVTLRGRSPSALLSSTYAASRTFTQDTARTAAQLASDELVNSGWTLVWDAPDWLLPAGTFTYQDLGPVEAIAQLAAAIGATVNTAPAAPEITIAPQYPVSPWAWDSASPFAILPASILTEGSTSWQGGTNANGIYVYPEGGGDGALVRLAGSDGASSLPMVVDRLLVHADAQRERGRAELAAAGRKRSATRTIPLFPAPPASDIDLGLIPIGALVDVSDPDETWRGQVRGVRIDAQRSGSALSVRQHLTIERQYR